MASATLVDMLSRTPAMDGKKKKWIQKAVPKSRHGVFKKKAEEAGESTREYAKEKQSAPGTLGKQARLAETLMGMSHKKKKSGMYDKSRDKMEG